MKIYAANGTTEQVVLDGDGLEVFGGMVTPIWPDHDDALVQNVSLTTTPTAHATASYSPPAWVQQVIVLASMNFQMTNSSVDKNMQFRIDIDGAPGTGGGNHGVSSTVQTTQHVSRNSSALLTSWSNPFNVDAVCSINTGTNASNVIRVNALVLGLRS
jgi:hypothetical protein